MAEAREGRVLVQRLSKKSTCMFRSNPDQIADACRWTTQNNILSRLEERMRQRNPLEKTSFTGN